MQGSLIWQDGLRPPKQFCMSLSDFAWTYNVYYFPNTVLAMCEPPHAPEQRAASLPANRYRSTRTHSVVATRASDTCGRADWAGPAAIDRSTRRATADGHCAGLRVRSATRWDFALRPSRSSRSSSSAKCWWPRPRQLTRTICCWSVDSSSLWVAKGTPSHTPVAATLARWRVVCHSLARSHLDAYTPWNAKRTPPGAAGASRDSTVYSIVSPAWHVLSVGCALASVCE